RMARLRLLDRIDRERPDRVDRQLVELSRARVAWVPFLHPRLVPLSPGRFLEMTAKLVAHRRQQLVCKIPFAARAEPFVESGGEHMGRNALVDGSLYRPAAFARVGHPPGEV